MKHPACDPDEFGSSFRLKLITGANFESPPSKMENDHATTTASYREELPAGCPPDEAEEIVEERVVFRIVRKDPPTHDDFRSQRAEQPFWLGGGERDRSFMDFR